MRSDEMRSLSDDELAQRMDEMYQELFNLRFQLVSGQLANPNRISEVKREIARIKTIARERGTERVS